MTEVATDTSEFEDIFEALDEAKTEQMGAIEEIEDFQETVERLDELDDDSECLHEQLEDSRPENHKGEAHMLSCPCPKCTPRC